MIVESHRQLGWIVVAEATYVTFLEPKKNLIVNDERHRIMVLKDMDTRIVDETINQMLDCPFPNQGCAGRFASPAIGVRPALIILPTSQNGAQDEWFTRGKNGADGRFVW